VRQQPPRRQHTTLAEVPVWLFLAGCADVTPPEDGAVLGPVVQLRDWFTSCFLLDADDVVLFDACWRPGHLEEALADHGLAPDDVTHVLSTHGDRDHVGGIEILGRAEVWGLPGDEDLLAEEGVRLDRTLADGEVLSLAGHAVEVLAVPGHTSGSAAYLVDGTLILGDAALVDRDGALVSVPEKRSDDPERAVESLRALADRLEPRRDEIRWLAPSHSAALAGFEPLAAF
jgi:glyoxylase-like metal-dependent hydrolase (beta-lactamase superfamily II)